MVALPLLPIVPVLALNVTVVAAAATVTEAGTVRMLLLFERVTLTPPLGAACVRVTVQVAEEFAPRLDGLQASEEISSGTRVTFAVADEPL
jgi:hypothetical protein